MTLISWNGLERFRRRAAMLVREPGTKSCEDQLKELGGCLLDKRKQRGNVIAVFQNLRVSVQQEEGGVL